jgi:hypothetical protein
MFGDACAAEAGGRVRSHRCGHSRCCSHRRSSHSSSHSSSHNSSRCSHLCSPSSDSPSDETHAAAVANAAPNAYVHAPAHAHALHGPCAPTYVAHDAVLTPDVAPDAAPDAAVDGVPHATTATALPYAALPHAAYRYAGDSPISTPVPATTVTTSTATEGPAPTVALRAATRTTAKVAHSLDSSGAACACVYYIIHICNEHM